MKVIALCRLAGAAALAAGIAACSGSSSGGSSPYGAGDPNLAASNVAGGPIDPFLTDGRAVLRALDAIASKSGTPLRVTTMDAADRTNGLSVDVMEPAHHVNVDRYVVAPDGTLTGPTPVKENSMDGKPVTAADVERAAFDPATIGLANLSRTAAEAIAKSTFSDARVEEWEYSGTDPDARRFMYLDAARGRPVAVLTAHMTLAKMQF